MAGNHGINRFIRATINVANDHLPDKATQDWADFGTIQADGSLLMDRFSVPYPKGSYAVAEPYLPPRNPPEVWDTTDPALVGVTDTGQSSSGASLTHTHTMPRPPVFTPLRAGDRVIVVYANDVDPCVLAKIYWSY